EMNHNHEIAMKKLDLELAKLQASIALSRAEFEDNKHRKDREYDESVSFRNNALSNLGKIAQAAAGAMGSAGVGMKVDPEDEVADIGEDAREQPAPTADKEPKATVKNFPCQFCHTMLTVPPGSGEVECSNDQCKAKYKIDI
ncbi:MAG: hypothetical protein PHU23_14640, partial [Dehalococcoidales bacterium]|nr:hypothetical protein [Dehalococcoidales bacterium]